MSLTCASEIKLLLLEEKKGCFCISEKFGIPKIVFMQANCLYACQLLLPHLAPVEVLALSHCLLANMAKG